MANIENVKIVRFLTGEEIIGEITSDSGEAITVKNPLRVLLVPSKTNPENPSVGLAPYAEFSDDKSFTFNRNHITVVYSPINEFVNQYNSMFGGLVVPNSKILTP